MSKIQITTPTVFLLAPMGTIKSLVLPPVKSVIIPEPRVMVIPQMIESHAQILILNPLRSQVERVSANKGLTITKRERSSTASLVMKIESVVRPTRTVSPAWI